MTNKTAFIVGTGPIGRHSARELMARGWKVSFLSRSAHQGLPGGASSAAVDARDPRALTEATAGARLIVHAANVPYQYWETDLPLLQEAAIAAAERQGAVLACADNLYRYDPEDQPFTERSATKPPSRKGALKFRLFESLMEAHGRGRIRAVAVQGSDYFGPEADWQAHFGTRFLKPLLAGKAPPLIGNLDCLHSFTYLPDFGRALAIAGTEERAWGRSWHAPTPPALSLGGMARLFIEASGKSTLRPRRLGRPAIALAGLFSPLIREFKEMLYEFEADFVMDSSDFERSFGQKPTDTERAVRETLDWFRSRRD